MCANQINNARSLTSLTISDPVSLSVPFLPGQEISGRIEDLGEDVGLGDENENHVVSMMATSDLEGEAAAEEEEFAVGHEVIVHPFPDQEKE